MIEQSIEELMELEYAPEEPKVFTIDSDSLAEWALKKIAEERAERDRLVAVAQAEIDHYQAYIDKQTDRCESKTDYLKSKLLDYFKTVKPKETATQLSYKLPAGSLIFKKEKDDYERDDVKLLAWAKDNCPDMVETTEKLKWGEFKKTLTMVGDSAIVKDTGEMVEGIKVITKPGSFDVKTEKI